MGVAGAAILLLPLLVSGYIFITIAYPFRYFSSHANGQKLFFMAGGAGTAIVAVSFVIAYWLAGLEAVSQSFAADISRSLNSALRFELASRLILAILLAVLFALLINLLMWWRCPGPWSGVSRAAFNMLTDHFGHPLAQMLRRAAVEDKQVLLSLKSRKVYCGRVIDVPQYIDQEGQYIEIFPAFSCARDEKTLRFNSQARVEYQALPYWEASMYLSSQEKIRKELDRIGRISPIFTGKPKDHDALLAEVEIHKSLIDENIKKIRETLAGFKLVGKFDYRDWIKVIPVSEIETASIFDSEAYKLFFSSSSTLEDNSAEKYNL